MNHQERERDQDSPHVEEDEIGLTVAFDDGGHVTVEAPFYRFWNMYEAFRDLGIARAMILVRSVEDWIDVLTDAGYNASEKLMEILTLWVSELNIEWEKERPVNEEEILQFTYVLLRQKAVTRSQAAGFASNMLGRKITTDAWRMRVDRWAKDRGLPKVGLYRRKSEAAPMSGE